MAPAIMLAAGGTGGHLFPAFALAEELRRRGITVDLATDERANRYGADFPARAVYRLPAASISLRSPGKAVRSTWTLTRGVVKALRLLARTRPAAVIGFGGYPTFAPLVAARLRGIPRAVHEANAVLGRVNRLLQRQVSAVATSFEHTRYLDDRLGPRVALTGNPVREAVLGLAERAFVPPDGQDPISLLVFGGSQGARFLSDTVPAALAMLPDDLRRRLAVTQQCRHEDLARVEAAYDLAGIRATLAEFFADLPERISQSHLVIARSGASTISELTVLGRPAILVPLPHALDNDQLYNATRLAEAGAAWSIEQSDLDANRLVNEIERLFRAPERLAAAANAARGLGKPEAASLLADLAERLGTKRLRTEQAEH